MLRWLLRRFRRQPVRGPYDTAVSTWIQFGAAYGQPPWTDENVIKYPSKTAMLMDPVWLRGDATAEVARDMRGDQPISPWRRSWSQDRKALRNEE